MPYKAFRRNSLPGSSAISCKLPLDVDKKRLGSAPGFDKDNWPDMTDTSWGSEVFTYYGATPYWEDYTERKTLHGGGRL